MENALLASSIDAMRVLRERKDNLARANQIDSLVRALLKPDDQSLDGNLVAELYAHWGDPLSDADSSLLRSCFAHVRVNSGHILQCGIGLSTLLLGIANARQHNNNHLWSLTDNQHWANTVRFWLAQYNIPNTHVVVCPPHLYDTYVWYGIDPKQLPDGFTLALPDGGRASVSGAVGLLSRMGDKLSDDCVVLARNLRKSEDQRLVMQWVTNKGLNGVMVDKSSGFYKVTKAVKKNRAYRAKAVQASLKLR